MKPVKVSVLVSKKQGKDFSSYSVSYGVTAELDFGEQYQDVIRRLDHDLKALVNAGLGVKPKISLVA